MKTPPWVRFAVMSRMAVLLAVARTANAHTVNLSQSDLALDGETVRGLVVFAKSDARRIGRMDEDRDGVVSPAELAASQATFRDVLARGFDVRADGDPCPASLEGGGDVEGDGFGLSVSFACPHAPRVLAIAVPLLRELPVAHREVLRLTAPGATYEAVLSRGAPRVEWSVASGRKDGPPFGGAFRLGIEHILTGWDHLLFLLALLVGTKGARSVILAVSAFTVAHSLSLAAAALGILNIPPRVVEPAIALSIAFVAFENLARGASDSRWRETLAFGLLHGLGFAAALRELSLPASRLLPVLLGFNVGVEVGQLAVVVPLVPLLELVRRRARWPWLRWVSMALVVVGVGVFVERLTAP